MSTTPHQSTQPFDCIIAGGGIGAFFAYALACESCRIALVDAVPTPTVQQKDFDARSLVLSQSSIRILKSLHLWGNLEAEATPIYSIHTSRRGKFGAARMKVTDHGVDMFGAIIELQSLYSTIRQKIDTHPHITNFCPAKVTGLTLERPLNQVHIETADGIHQILSGKLLVAADGTNSFIRKNLGIEVERFQYDHNAIVANVGLHSDHHHQSFERFTEEGPIALLPLRGKRCALVHSVANNRVDEIMNLDDDQYLTHIQKRFGYRLGIFTRMGKRFTFPLERIIAKEQIRPGVVLLGNSAHTLHPVAGQGFNLALRDCATLAEVVKAALEAKQNPGDYAVLQTYLDERSPNQKRIIQLTHSLIQYLSTNNTAFSLATTLGLTTIDKLPPLKKMLTRLSMGLSTPQSQLVRGISLYE